MSTNRFTANDLPIPADPLIITWLPPNSLHPFIHSTLFDEDLLEDVVLLVEEVEAVEEVLCVLADEGIVLWVMVLRWWRGAGGGFQAALVFRRDWAGPFWVFSLSTSAEILSLSLRF